MSTITNYSLDQFPNEILLKIFCCETNNIKNINNVSKKFKQLTEDVLLKAKFLEEVKLKLYNPQVPIVIFPYQVSETPNFYNYIASVLSGKIAFSKTKVVQNESNTFLDRHLINGKIYSFAESKDEGKGIIHIYDSQSCASLEYKFELKDERKRVCLSPQRHINNDIYLTAKVLDFAFDEWVHDQSIYLVTIPDKQNLLSSKKHKAERYYLETKNIQKFPLPENIHQVVSIIKDFYIGLNIKGRRLELCPWSQETYTFNIPDVVDAKATDDVIIMQIVQKDKSYYQWFNLRDIKIDSLKKNVTIENIQTVDLLRTIDFPTNDPTFINSLKLLALKDDILFLNGIDSIYVIDLKENKLTNTICYKNYMQTYDKTAYKELISNMSSIRQRNFNDQVIVKICNDRSLPRMAYQWPLLIIAPPGDGCLQFHHLENHSFTESKFTSDHFFEIHQSQLYRYVSNFEKTQIAIHQLGIKQEKLPKGTSNKK